MRIVDGNSPVQTRDVKILILGATGMLGHKMWQLLGKKYPDCFASIRKDPGVLVAHGLHDGTRIVDGVDALDFAAVHRLLEDIRPAVVINCIAVTKRREQSEDPYQSIELNAALPHRLARWATSRGARLIHFSTDCVFDGKIGNYTEASPTNAEDLYGRTKALGEVSAANAITLRTSLVGREIQGKTELLEWFLAQRGRSIRGFRRALYTGVSTLWMTDLVAHLIESFGDLSGIYQIAAPVVSKYQLLLYARDAFGVEVDIQPDDSVIVHRNLDGSRFSARTGIHVPDWRSMMAALAADKTPYDLRSSSNAS